MATYFLSTIIFFAIILVSVLNGQLLSPVNLSVDFTSTVSYSGSECGGALLLTDTTTYPPCKSFKDAGNRARQYLNTPAAIIPNSNRLLISVINGATTSIINGESSQFGNLYGFCSVEISVADANTYVIMDGTLSTAPFLSLEEPTVPDTSYVCSTGKSVKVKYMKFINWGDQTIIYTNVNQINSPTTKISMNLQYFYVTHSSSIINIQPKGTSFDFNAISVAISVGDFHDIYTGPNALPPLNFIGASPSLTKVNVYDSNISEPLIYTEKGGLIFKSSSIVNVIISDNRPLFKSLNSGANLRFMIVDITNSVLSTFFYATNTMVVPIYFDGGYNFASITFTNNTIITSTGGLPNSFVCLQTHTLDNYMLQSNVITFNGNNLISIGKSLFWLLDSHLTFDSSIVSQDFIAFYSQNSEIKILFGEIYSLIPLAGNNSKLDIWSPTTISASNYSYCNYCLVTFDDVVVYDTQ